MGEERFAFFSPEEILRSVKERIAEITDRGEKIDYLTFVPDGEPTLDLNLGKEIELLHDLGVKIAVITNASLLWRSDVRKDLSKADWVSLKVDSVSEQTWRKIDRPHGHLQLKRILEGMRLFAKEFSGTLVTETMLVAGLNDNQDVAQEIAEFIFELKPSCAYILIPTRPPAEDWVCPPSEEKVIQIYQIYKKKIANVEYLIGYEGNAFSSTGNPEVDLLSITAVHPMREDAVSLLLKRCNSDWSLVDHLLASGQLRKVDYQGQTFFVRVFAERDKVAL
jgi:wyosine [tRNA(Phe)-imidazoG37] synthetase (radical SAM superfamily)